MLLSSVLAGHKPFPFGDKHSPSLRPLHAQPEKRVTRAASSLGAETAKKPCNRARL